MTTINSSSDVLVLFSQFVRNININSKKSYDMASNVNRFMVRYLNSVADCIIELEVESQAVVSLQKYLQRRIKTAGRTLKIK